MKIIKCFLILILLEGCFGATPETTKLEGTSLPEFGIQLPDSVNYANTNKIPKGKAVAIYYFSPICPYCRAQTTEIIDDMDLLKDIQFYFVSAFPIPDVKKFCAEFKLEKYSNIIVGRDTSTAIANYFEISGVPYMAIYGKERKLNHSFLGKIYSSQIKKTALE